MSVLCRRTLVYAQLSLWHTPFVLSLTLCPVSLDSCGSLPCGLHCFPRASHNNNSPTNHHLIRASGCVGSASEPLRACPPSSMTLESESRVYHGGTMGSRSFSLLSCA